MPNEHTCHAKGCDKPVPPRMFMCRPHWYMIPKKDRDRLWAVYVPGQERRKDPTDEYLEVAHELVELVAAKEAAKRRLVEGTGQPPAGWTPQGATERMLTENYQVAREVDPEFTPITEYKQKGWKA